MFLVRGILWGCCLLWISEVAAVISDEAEIEPWHFWIHAVATICYVLCVVNWKIKPGNTVWKETIALGATLVIPFYLPGAVLLVIGVIGGIRSWKRKQHQNVEDRQFTDASAP